MSKLEALMFELVEAPSQVVRKKVIKRISVTFYKMCIRAGMEPQEIISLSSEIIGIFNSDINHLKNKKINITQ